MRGDDHPSPLVENADDAAENVSDEFCHECLSGLEPKVVVCRRSHPTGYGLGCR